MRIRTIKPSFFTDDQLAELPLAARMLFIGLWCAADREGRLEDRPKKIKVEIFPYDDVPIDDLLHALHSRAFIQRYEVYGKRFICIPSFAKHQRPNNKETVSTIPGNPDCHAKEDPLIPDEAPLFSDEARAGAKEGKGREQEGKGMDSVADATPCIEPSDDGDPRPRRATKEPLAFTIAETLRSISEGSGGRVITAPYDSALSKNLTRLIRELMAQRFGLEHVRLAGEYIATWPKEYVVDVSWLATNGKLIGAIARAVPWAEEGRPRQRMRGNGVTPVSTQDLLELADELERCGQ